MAFKSEVLENYKSIIAFKKNQDCSKSDAEHSTYCDITVENLPSGRKGAVLPINKIYTSGRDKLKSAGLPQGSAQKQSVRLRFYTKTSEKQMVEGDSQKLNKTISGNFTNKEYSTSAGRRLSSRNAKMQPSKFKNSQSGKKASKVRTEKETPEITLSYSRLLSENTKNITCIDEEIEDGK